MHANSWVRVYGRFILGDAASNFHRKEVWFGSRSESVLTLEEDSKEPNAEASHHPFKQSVAWSPCGLGRLCPISTHNPMYRTVNLFSKHIEWGLAWRTKSRHLAINTAAVRLLILSISKNFIMKIVLYNCHWNGNRFILGFFFCHSFVFPTVEATKCNQRCLGCDRELQKTLKLFIVLLRSNYNVWNLHPVLQFPCWVLSLPPSPNNTESFTINCRSILKSDAEETFHSAAVMSAGYLMWIKDIWLTSLHVYLHILYNITLHTTG